MVNKPVGATFAFTKLVVRDLDKAADFYAAVCGYSGGQRVKAETGGRQIEEIIYRKSQGGVELVLLAYLEGPPTACGNVITAFDTPDLEGFQSRLLAAGGSLVEPIKTVEFRDNRMRIGFYTDLDGYLLEVIER